jgi:hypothetical protein
MRELKRQLKVLQSGAGEHRVNTHRPTTSRRPSTADRRRKKKKKKKKILRPENERQDDGSSEAFEESTDVEKVPI